MSAPVPGQIIDGRFRIEERVGRGGYGDVFRATQLSVERTVALKLVHPHLVGRSDVVGRFRREARLTSRLDHPNAVRVLDFGEDAGTLYLAMEFVRGPTLKAELAERGALPAGEVRAIAVGIARALAAAHAIELVHRDLKPSNVLLTDGPEGVRPVVIDFGLVKAFADEDAQTVVTRSNVMIGTPAYMSPENVLGRPLDGRADLYSLGVMIFEMLTNQRPFSGTTPIESATARLTDEPPLLPASTPEPLSSLVTALLKRAPDDRPPSADAVLALLERSSTPGTRPSTSDAPTVAIQRPDDLTIAPVRGPGAAPTPPTERATAGARILGPPKVGRGRFSLPAFLAIVGGLALLLALAATLAPTSGRPQLGTPAPERSASSATMTTQTALPRATPTADALAREQERGIGRPETAPSVPGHVPREPDHSVTDTRIERSAAEANEVGEAEGDESARAAVAQDSSDAEEPEPDPPSAGERAEQEDPSRPARRDVQTRPEPGSLTVNVEPFGDVFVDGNPVGEAPIHRLDVAPGTYRVLTRYLGQEREELIAVSPGEHQTITHRFRR